MRLNFDEETGKLQAELSANQFDFAGGLNETNNLAPNQSPNCLNVYADDDGTLKMRPFTKVKKWNLGFAPKRGFSYVDRQNEEIAILTDNSKVYYSNNLTDWNTVPNSAGTGDLTLNNLYETRFTSYKNNLWGTNGYDDIWYWDGGATSTSLSWFASGEKPRYLVNHLDRLFFANNPLNPDYLYFSDVGGNSLDPLNFIAVRSKHSGHITGLSVCTRGLIIFKNDSIFLLTGYSPETFSLNLISENIGCVNSNSIQEYLGSVYFLGSDGFYKTDGIQVQKMPDFIPKTLNEISQVYKWDLKEFYLKDSGWERYSDTSPTDEVYFIPNEENDPETTIYQKNVLYNEMEGTSDLWTKTDSISDLKFWNSTDQNALLINPQWLKITSDIDPSRVDWLGFKAKKNWQIFDRPDDEFYAHMKVYLISKETGDNQRFDLFTMDIRKSNYGGHLQQINLATLGLTNAKYKYKKFDLVIEIWNKEGMYRVGSLIHDYYKWYNSQLISSATIENFFIPNGSAILNNMSFNFYLYDYWGEENVILAFETIGTRGMFNTLRYYSLPINVQPNRWGVIDYNYLEYEGYGTKEVRLSFFNGTTWSAWSSPVTAGSNIQSYDPYYDPGTKKTTTKQIKIYIYASAGASPQKNPFRFNGVYLSWYETAMDIPMPDFNISSIIWKNRYLMAYCKTGEGGNNFAIVMDELYKTPRYFKWYFDRQITTFLYFTNKIYPCIKYGNYYNLYEFTEDANEIGTTTGTIVHYYDIYYWTKEFDFEYNGIRKDFDSANFIIKNYPNDNSEDNLKCEIWIDKKYNGDIDFWLRKDASAGEYFSTKHTALLKHSQVLNSVNVSLQKPEGYLGAGYNYDEWTKNIVPFGFGNKLQFRFFWGRIWEDGHVLVYVANPCCPSKKTIEMISIDMYLNKDVFYEPKANLYEGEL